MYMNTWAIHCRYRRESSLCGWNVQLGVLETCVIKMSDKIHTVGLSSLRHGGPSQGATTSPTLSKVAPAGPARSTPPPPPRTPLWSEGVLVGKGSARRGKLPTVWKASARRVSSQPSLYSQRFCLHGETTTKSWTASRGRAWRRTGQSVLSSGLCLSVSTVLFVSHRSFYSPYASPSMCRRGARWRRFL